MEENKLDWEKAKQHPDNIEECAASVRDMPNVFMGIYDAQLNSLQLRYGAGDRSK